MRKRKKILVLIITAFYLISQLCSFAYAGTVFKIVPELVTVTHGGRLNFTAAMICRLIEKELVKLEWIDQEKAILKAITKLKEVQYHRENIQIEYYGHEIIINVPDQGVAIRYRYTKETSELVPFARAQEIRQDDVGNGFSRQIIYYPVF